MNVASRFMIVAFVAFIGCLFAWSVTTRQFFLAYLAAVMLPWSVSVGSLGLILIFLLTGGKWGRAASPWLVVNARLVPLVAILFVPLLFGIEQLYPWADSEMFAQFQNTENRRWYFQIPFFIGRTVFYFVVWSILSWVTTGGIGGRGLGERLALNADTATAHSAICHRGGQPFAGLGLIALLLTVTWAGIDWVMSFDPFFDSTLFGALLGIGGLLSALSAVVAAVCFWPPLGKWSEDERTIGDLAGLLLAFLMLWAYFSFAHFLIMWMGNLPSEARFYAVRMVGVWGWIAPLLAVGGFVIPLLCLLSYRFKRTRWRIGTLAIGLLCVRIFELWWMVLPADGVSAGGRARWVILPTSIAVIACYLAGLCWLIDRANREKASGITHAL